MSLTEPRDRLRRSRIRKLAGLSRKKLDIEARMAAEIDKLEVAYVERAQELSVVEIC